ncbi:MAG TPA: plastocyanin/azurin family copper-binding protein [Gemmatimonadaceae bacterium]|jgi:plastocyanin|nr:plastocyanin/azurin family copper-binding protein [Gemmatimonadaceae bacterium]
MRFLVTLISLVALNHVPPATPDPVAIDLKTFQFAPDTLRVSVGTTVRWTNQDDIEHTVTAGSPSERDASFNATLAKKGATAERMFDRAGTFMYFCDRHQFMRGTITVTR